MHTLKGDKGSGIGLFSAHTTIKGKFSGILKLCEGSEEINGKKVGAKFYISVPIRN